MRCHRVASAMKDVAVNGVVLLMLCSGSQVYGESGEVIYQGQNTVSTQRYYSALKQKRPPTKIESARKLPIGQAVTLEGRLPIEPKRLVAAEPSVIEVNRLLTPVFVIGSDAQSINWLQQNGELFRDLGAVGIVAELRDMAAWRDIQSLGQQHGLRLHVLNGDAIAEAFNIEHYPVLIQGVKHGE